MRGDDTGILQNPPERKVGKSGVTGDIEVELESELWREVFPHELWSPAQTDSSEGVSIGEDIDEASSSSS
jgi:hypothetical protein